MMIRTRLKILASGATLLAILATFLAVWGYQQIQMQQRHLEVVQQIRADAMDLNIITLDLLNGVSDSPQTGQWLAIYQKLGGRIDTYLAGSQTLMPALKPAHDRIGKRFDAYLQALYGCKKRQVAADFASKCAALLDRMKTQVRITLQELLVETGRVQQTISSRIQQQFYISGVLLLALPILAALLTVVIVLPMVARLNSGLTRLLEAGHRFSSGDLDYRLRVDGQDEMGMLASTYNQMAQRRQQAEQALKKSETNLAQAQSVAQIGVWELDLVQDSLWWSDEVFRIFEIDQAWSEASYEAFLKVIHPDDRDRVNQAYQESVASHEPYDIIHRLLFAGGRIKYVNERCQTHYDETGRAIRSLGTVQNITEHYAVEKALRENETLYRQLIESMSDGVAIYEAVGEGDEFIFKEHNPAGERITGLTREQVIGKPVTEAFPGIRESGLFDVFQRVWRSGKGEQYPITHYQDQRITLWVENHIFKLPSGELVAVYEDATRRKLAETDLQHRLTLESALAQASTDLVQVADDQLGLAIDRALEHIGRAVGADRSYLFQVDDTTVTFSNTHEWCAEGIASQKPELQEMPLDEFDAAFVRFREGEALIVHDPETIGEELSTLRDFMQETGIRSLINVPVIWKKRLLGVVGFDTEKTSKIWPEEDTRLLHTLAESFAGAFERWESSRRIREHAWFLESLDRVSRILTAERDVVELQRRLMDLILEIFDADRAWLLYPCDPEAPTNQVKIESTRPEFPGAIAEGEQIARTRFSAELKRKALAVDDPLIVQIEDHPDTPEYFHRYQIKSLMQIVLRPQVGEPWLLGIHQCSSRRLWSEVEQHLFRTIAERVGSALSGKLLLEKVRENEQRLLQAEHIAQIGSWERDLCTDEAIWSDQEYICLGYPPRSCEASFENFIAVVHPDDKSLVLDAVEAAMSGKTKRYDIAHRVIWQDGSEHVVHQRGILDRDENGIPLRIVGTTQDITEQMRLEQELEAHRRHLQRLVDERTKTIQQQAKIIDQTHDSVVTTDLDGFITSWNGGAERVFGIPGSQAIGRHASIVYPDQDQARLESNVIAPLKEKGVHEMEAKLQRADGTEFPVHLSMSMLYDDGRPSGMVGYVVDISELKQREQDLQRLSERLQSANQELESFSYSVSHDLRAPLRAIDGFSLALVEDYGGRLDDTGLDYLQRVRKGAQRMGLLIDDMLQLSRVNRAPLQLQDVDLSKIARAVVEELQAGEPGRDVALTLAPGMRTKGDSRLLRMMLDNLLGNAWKFTSREPSPLITFGRLAKDPSVFYIRDNGVGFDMRHADKLFGAFQRLHQISDFPGTGVGLATVQRIINRHGGRIWAEAEVGKGATFFFSLNPEQASGN